MPPPLIMRGWLVRAWRAWSLYYAHYILARRYAGRPASTRIAALFTWQYLKGL